jgi:hypothetical protein
MCAELYQCWLTDRRHMAQPEDVVEYPQLDPEGVAATVHTLRRHSITGRIPPPIPRPEKDELDRRH